MVGYFFFGFRNRGTIHCSYTDWNRQDNVENNSECVRLKEECQTRLGCPEGVTVHTAGRDEEHADEEVLQNNSL